MINKGKNNEFNAFTLAEVIIVVGIIGIVALFAVPALVQGMQEKATVTAVKKAYSTLSNAYTLAVQQNGDPTNWDLRGTADAQGAINMVTILAPYLNIQKNCNTTDSTCFPTGNYKYLSVGNEVDAINTSASFSRLQLVDGSLLGFTIINKDCANDRGNSLMLDNICAVVVVDVNGFKSPNKLGVDTFYFNISKYGIIPHGSQLDTRFPFGSHCEPRASATGWGCTAWVIYNENLDYIHCNGLSWDGPTKCP